MKNQLFQNWILKLTSVVIAIVLWVIVYSINDPVATKRLSNVPVTFVNVESVTDNNQVYQVLEGTDEVRTITINASRSIIDDLKESDIHVEADFTKRKMDGTIELNIYSDRHNESISFNSSIKEVKVLIEDKIDRYMSLDIDMIGEPIPGYIIGSYNLGQNQIKISGGESVVNSVARAAAKVDMTGTSESIVTYADIFLYDAEGEEIPMSRLEVSVKEVITTVEVLATKTVPITYVATGTAAEGFVATGDAESKIEELVIAGKSNVIAPITEIVVEGEEITVEGASEDVKLVVDLDNYLPVGVTRANKQGNGQVEVTFSIAPVVDKEIMLHAGQVTIENVPEKYEVKHVLRGAELVVVVRGADYLVENLSSSDIRASFDVTAWMEENDRTVLSNGATYEVIPVYELEDGLEVTSSMPIEIIAKVLEE